MQKTTTGPALDLIDNFPSYERAGPYLRKMITRHNHKLIADIGGGANPVLDNEFILQNGIRYFLIDQSPTELQKASPVYDKIEADATSSTDVFQRQIGGRKFDLIFSHMFLEHVEDPMQAHRNFYAALNPGGRCVHIYPSPNNLPLALNRILPEAISRCLVKIVQPVRDLDGSQRKFKAYYRMCGAPSPALTAAFEGLGFTVERHTGYVGHPYYERFGPLAALERQVRKIARRFELPLTTGCLLVLAKPGNPGQPEFHRA